MERIADWSPRARARLAGFFYLIVIVTGGWAELFVRAHLYVRNNAAATAANIATQEPLFRGGFAADLIGVVCYIAVVFMLYELLKPASRSFSLLAAFFGMVGNAVFAINLLNHLAAVVLLDNAHVLAAFKPDQVQALAFLFLKLHTQGYVMVMVFFGFYLTFVGVAIFQSGFLPRILGVLLVLGGLGDVTNSFVVFLSVTSPLVVNLASYAFQLGGISEVALALWLSVMGVNNGKWRQQAGPVAVRAATA